MARGIPVDCIDTHLLQSGGANALSLAGYSDAQIQKMGRWRGATFKEYIRVELAGFSAGMSRSMKQRFDLVNIAGNAFNIIMDDLLAREYEINVSTAAAAQTTPVVSYFSSKDWALVDLMMQGHSR